MKHYDLEQKIKKLKEISSNQNSLLKRDEKEISQVAAVVNEDINTCKQILLRKKEVEEKIKELDAKLDELMNSTVEVYNHSSMSAEAHIRSFASYVAKLNEVSTELDNLINVQRPELQKQIFDEEIEKKQDLIPIWNSIKDSFYFEPEIETLVSEDKEDVIEEVTLKENDKETESDDEQIAELKKFIAASMEPPKGEVLDALEDLSTHTKKKRSFFNISKKRA